MELLTEELRKQLPHLYSQEHEKDPMVMWKFFHPLSNMIWYAIEGSDADCPRWTEDEKVQLRACYPDKVKLMEALPTRMWAGILHRACEIGLASTNPRLSQAAFMALEDLLTHQDKQVMIY